MPLIVEDGSLGSPLGNSFVSLAEIRTFWADRADDIIANASPSVPTDAVLTAAALRAMDYMIQTWRLRWTGSRATPYQPLDWPRKGVPIPDFFDPFFRNVNVPYEFRNTEFIAENTIPREVKEAQILLTRAALSDATTVINLNAALGRVTQREKLGDLEVEYAVGENVSAGTRLRTLYIDALGLVEPYLESDLNGQALRG